MNSKYLWLVLFSLYAIACQRAQPAETTFDDPRQSMSPDQRYGTLFEYVQMAQVFPDGKTFADCIPKVPTDTILARFAANPRMKPRALKEFVTQYFNMPPMQSATFQSDTSLSPAEHINRLWEVLTRQPDISDRGSLIPLPHPYMVPGGRFREIYYWDSYFTMLGLQVAGKTDMIENMVDNFAHLIDTIGFIPNGNRTYYLSRSQPPFFALMVELLAELKGDDTYRKYLPQLQKEYNFWVDRQNDFSVGMVTNKRYVTLKDGTMLNRYWDERDKPRPESFREDFETAAQSNRPRPEVYRNIRAACESGWDFSSRWLKDGQTLETIRTTEIIPVDLNALLYHLEKTLEKAYTLQGNTDNANLYRQLSIRRAESLLRYAWNPRSGFFEDYDFINDRQTGILSLAGMYPLFFKIASPEQAAAVAKVIERDFLKAGGVVTTLANTGQQWDAPNGWAPLQWMTIQGLRNYGFNALADSIKQRWIDLNVRVYKNTGKMVEKYNVLDMELLAGGGEYPVQDGFGWTNGVLLRLLSE